MKISAVETYLCSAHRANWVFVRVLTDGGLSGVGEATLEFRERTVRQALEELGEDLIGRDPSNIELICRDAYRDSYWRSGPVLGSALSAVEMALWDIKGKALGVPVWQLLGGAVRRSIPCYANAWFVGAKRPEEFARKARETVDRGFLALKWDPFGSAWLTLDRRQFTAAIDCVRAVTEAVDGRADIIIDGRR